MTTELKLSKEEPPMGYSIIGWFTTRKEAEAWYNAARKAGKKYPFWLTYEQFLDTKKYFLWWKKEKNTKKSGKGFTGG